MNEHGERDFATKVDPDEKSDPPWEGGSSLRASKDIISVNAESGTGGR